MFHLTSGTIPKLHQVLPQVSRIISVYVMIGMHTMYDGLMLTPDMTPWS